MPGDIVIISDTEELSDEEIAFVGINQTNPRPRVSHTTSSRSAPIPIFIDSDPEDNEPTLDDKDDSDIEENIYDFIASTITSTSTSTVISGPSSIPLDPLDNGIKKAKRVGVDRKGKRKAVDHESMNGMGNFDLMESSALMQEFEKFENSILSKIDSLTSLNDKTEITHASSTDATESSTDAAKKKPKKRKSSSTAEPASTTPAEKRKKSSEDPQNESVSLPPKPKLTKEEREALKAKEKAEKQLQKDTEKAAKEAERSYQKKVNEVNRLRVSKNDTVREIHLYLSADLSNPNSPISGALPEIKTRITDNYSELHFLTEEQSPIQGLIRFKRHLKARWDTNKKQFIPLDNPKWVWESTILVIVNAEEIVDKISSSLDEGGGEDGVDELSLWISDIRLTLGLNRTDQILIMIKGLNKYYSKSKSIANKEFTAAARAGLNGTTSSSSQIGSNRNLGKRPDKETIEMALVELQVKQRCFLVHMEKTEDIEDWIYNIAADVAIRPYKLISKSHLNFCPTDGIKKASNPTETFELMLQEVQGITPSASMGIASEYPTFRDLMESYEKAERRGGVERAEIMLQDCEIKTLRNGTANGRKLNKALAKRVYNVFRGEDSLALA